MRWSAFGRKDGPLRKNSAEPIEPTPSVRVTAFVVSLPGSSGGDTVGGTSRRIYILPAGILIPFTAFAQKVKNGTIAPGWAYGARWPESSAKGAEKVEYAVAVAS